MSAAMVMVASPVTSEPRGERVDRHLVIGMGVALALIGAILAFALAKPETVFVGLRLRAVGWIALVFGLSVLAVSRVWRQQGGAPEESRGQTPLVTGASVLPTGGLMAVIVAILAVLGMGVFTIIRLGTDDSTSAVAIATAAFGVISAVVGAYLGLRVGTQGAAGVQEDLTAANARAGALQALVPNQEEAREKAGKAADSAVDQSRLRRGV